MPNLFVSNPHPTGWTNPAVLRALAALTAAWDAAPTEQVCMGADTITLAFTYTRGAAGGAFDFQVQISPYSVAANAPAGASEWIIESLEAKDPVVPGADTQSLIQREYLNYTSQGAAAEAFVYGPINLQTGIERILVRARETANEQEPGDLQITGVLKD